MARARDVANIDGILTTTGDIYYASGANTPARLGIGSTGNVLTVASGIPSWAAPASGSTFIGVKATMSSLASISNNTHTLLTFDTEDFDTNGFHSTSSNTGRITIPSGQNGYYQVILELSANFAGSGIRRATLYLNGAATARQTSLNAAGAGQTKFQLVALLNLVATDYLEFYVYQDSGSILNFDTGNTFSAIKLGA